MTESIWPKLGLEHDWKFIRTTNLNNWTWPKFTTPTNINFTPQKYAGAVGLPAWLAPSLCSSSRKNKTGLQSVSRPVEQIQRKMSFSKKRRKLGRNEENFLFCKQKIVYEKDK